MQKNFDNFFYPKSIAIVGASNDINKIGGFLFSQIKARRDLKPIPINNKEDMIQGHRAYKKVSDYSFELDLVIIAIPAAFVLQTVLDVANSGRKNIIIISAGFKETNEEGKKRESELKKIIHQHKLNIIGPNCLGILNAEIDLNCSFAKDVPRFGRTALISQSGAVIDGIIDWSFKHRIGFSKIVSMGNMAGIDELDMLEYLKNDPKTKSIVFYMETLEKGKKFSNTLKEISKQKPVIIIKPGTSENAKKAIGSHTGSLAQDNVLVETLIKESNGIMVENLNELFNVMVALQGKFQKGKNLVIITNAGGPGVIATDALAKTNFNLYKFNSNEKAKFEFLPSEASVNNPIDILGDAKSDRYVKTLEELTKFEQVQNILILLTPQIMTDSENIAREITKISARSTKNIFAAFIGDKEIKKGLDVFDQANFPNFQTPSEALNAMGKLLDYSNFDYHEHKLRTHPDMNKINHIREQLRTKNGMLDYTSTKNILNVLGIGMPDKKVIHNLKDIDTIKLDKVKKYILKVDSKDIIHKKDVGGIVHGVTIENFKEKATKLFYAMNSITKHFSITIEEKFQGVEVIVGLKESGELGNFILFGMGGTYVSVFNDINFASCPLSKEQAINLVESSKVNTLLKGYRGDKPVDYEHLYELLIRISYLQHFFPEIKEVDLNPIICNYQGIYLVDVKLIVDHS